MLVAIIVLAWLLAATWIAVGVLLSFLWDCAKDHDSWIRRTCERTTAIEASFAEQRAELNALAGVVADNADRCTRLETGDAPRRPVSPATYLADRYPKRADEL